MGDAQLSSAAILHGENCLWAKVSLVNYSPHKDGCLCEINDVFINKPTNHIGRMVTLLVCETQTLKTSIQQLYFYIYNQDHNAVGSKTNAAIFGHKKIRGKTPIVLMMDCADH